MSAQEVYQGSSRDHAPTPSSALESGLFGFACELTQGVEAVRKASQPFRFSDFDRAVKSMTPDEIEAVLAARDLEARP